MLERIVEILESLAINELSIQLMHAGPHRVVTVPRKNFCHLDAATIHDMFGESGSMPIQVYAGTAALIENLTIPTVDVVGSIQRQPSGIQHVGLVTAVLVRQCEHVTHDQALLFHPAKAMIEYQFHYASIYGGLEDVLCTSETRCRFVSFLSHDCVPVVDEQSQFGCCQPNRPEPCGEFAVIVYRCRDRAVVLYPLAHSSNAIPDDLYTMMSSRTEVVSVSQSLIIFAYCIFGFTFPRGRISELTALTLYLPV